MKFLRFPVAVIYLPRKDIREYMYADETRETVRNFVSG